MLYEKLQKIVKEKGYKSLTKALPLQDKRLSFDIEHLRELEYDEWPDKDKEILLNILIN